MGARIKDKWERIQLGEPPRLLDLFSGCGGMALGFVTAGCFSIGGIEIDKDASRSYALNFHHHKDGEPDELQANPKDILRVKPSEFLDDLRWRTERGVDIIVGGPPCPAFTRVGRAKLREVAKDPVAFKNDPRARLYVPYLEYVDELKPLALVMENVPDILNWGGHNLGDEICESLEQLGYKCAYTLLNAANYGVPQLRERFFLVAIHEKLGLKPSFPEPTRRGNFPPGYEGSRKVALKHILHTSETQHSRFRAPAAPPLNARPWVTVEEALADLPPLEDHIHGLDRRGTRRLNGKLPYGDNPPSAYARLMKEWPDFPSAGYLRDHVTRCLTQRDYRLFKRMKPGDDYPKAHALAEKLYEQQVEKCRKSGQPLPRRADYVPPYDPKKFPNKWRKMAKDEPARTLMAHLGKDTYSHIHYESSQQRVISVREAARLQSFPDGFRFSGTMNPAFRQIGNSVPPLLAWAIAHELLATLGARVAHPFPDYVESLQSGKDSVVRVVA
ncbi:DNA cytosine methyltransferase [Myxococcus sp. RHSTA-1-4]|uniref:DNA cytosine methyltransferase n=1 Tax=Myxococcus sp. RHSTA-1-4 TaxID=2874601 RepID=UPI001CC11FB3|nr:DNA cytosine methyltransferase [Myxococcus sp. RHSTA-1-4]MBZ4416003.1 DNA cytosine methyltransferase [Myxococcus sp. RHSTA-1-4]